MKLGMQVGLGPGHIVLDGDPALLPQRGTPPIFNPYPLRPNGCIDQDFTWYGDRPRPRRLCVRWGPCCPSQPCRPQPRQPCGVRWGPSPLPKKGAEPPPQFLAHFYCGQTAGCTKVPLGTELGLSPEDFVLDGDPAPPQKGGGAPAPKFSAHVCCGQTAG